MATANDLLSRPPRLEVLDLPELTTWLIGNYTQEALEFYNTTLNEEQGEVWLHRGFQHFLSSHQQRQHDRHLDYQNKHSEYNNIIHISSSGIDRMNLLKWWQWVRSSVTSTTASKLVRERHSSDENKSIAGNDTYPNQNKIVIICAYLHFNQYLYQKMMRRQHRKSKGDNGNKFNIGPPYSTDEVMKLLERRIQNQIIHHADQYYRNINKTSSTSTTFVLAVPTWNPKRGNDIGLSHLQQIFQKIITPPSTTISSTRNVIRYMSLGYERNIYWQKMPSPEYIVPIPYVVTMTPPTKATSSKSMHQKHHLTIEKLNNERSVTVFYIGDTRPNAVKWSGCNRTALLQPIIDQYGPSSTLNTDSRRIDSNIYVRLIDSNKRHRHNNTTRLSMAEYNDVMRQSKYCLIVCGDTPTSRSLSSAIIHGCIPLFIGKERWYGYCGSKKQNSHFPSVCHAGWGWNVLHDETLNHDKISTQQNLQRQNRKATNDMPSSTAISHFPYETIIDYGHFPSMDEDEFIQNPVLSLQRFLNSTSSPSLSQLQWKGKYMNDHSKDAHPATTTIGLDDPIIDEDNMFRSAFIYGYGHPVTTELFGNAVHYIWESIVDHAYIFE